MVTVLRDRWMSVREFTILIKLVLVQKKTRRRVILLIRLMNLMTNFSLKDLSW